MFTIPKLTDLRDQIQSDLESAFGVTIPSFGKNFLRIFAGVQAAKLWILYKLAGYIQKNIAPDTADSEQSGGTLERFGRIKIGRNPFTARAAQYYVQVSGAIGATINAKTTFKSDNNSANPGKLFIVDSNFILETSPDIVLMRALEAGLDSKLSPGDGLVPTTVIAGVNNGGTVQSSYIDPLAAEDIETYRGIVVDSYQTETQGGAGTDYRAWAADAQGIQEVYPYAKTGHTGQIDLYVEATSVDSIDGKGTPSQALLDAVEEVVNFDPDTTKPLNQRGRRPLQVIVNYLPVTIVNVTVDVSGFVGLTVEKQTAITEALTEFINTIRPFVASADVLENKNSILDNNRVINTILNTYPGSTFGVVTIGINGVPDDSYEFLNGNIPYVLGVTFS